MNCNICGAGMEQMETDLPFKLDERSIIIIKGLPVLQCSNCREYLIEDSVMERLDTILAQMRGGSELEVVKYAA